MASIQRYSTRLRGFHLRNYRVAGGEETEMFTAELYLHDDRVGFIRNHGHGGPDFVEILARRHEWNAFAQYIHEHPMMLDEGGKASQYVSADEDASAFLRAMAKIEDELRRSRKYHSGAMGHVWGSPYPGMEHWAVIDAVRFFWGIPGLDAETILAEISPDTFWIVILGRDNPEFLRAESVPHPGAPGREPGVAPAVADPLLAAGYEVTHTGGGCMAWMRALDDTGESYVLITSHDDVTGDPEAPEWCVGRYDGSSWINLQERFTLAEALRVATLLPASCGELVQETYPDLAAALAANPPADRAE